MKIIKTKQLRLRCMNFADWNETKTFNNQCKNSMLQELYIVVTTVTDSQVKKRNSVIYHKQRKEVAVTFDIKLNWKDDTNNINETFSWCQFPSISMFHANHPYRLYSATLLDNFATKRNTDSRMGVSTYKYCVTNE